MGATDFTHTAEGKTAKEAFETAREDAFYEYGHGGYTGTIAEKCEFRVIKCPPGKTPREVINEVFKDWEHWAFDKWGPCAAIQTGDNEWTFFGLAST